jgi:hypothetical protein
MDLDGLATWSSDSFGRQALRGMERTPTGDIKRHDGQAVEAARPISRRVSKLVT